MVEGRELPPGQRTAELERFGLPQFARRHVATPHRPTLTVSGVVRHPTQLDLEDLLDGLPRHEQRSDFHCVTTWSALDLVWSGVRFSDVAQRISEVVRPHPGASWLMATGLDGFRSCLKLDDALADDVMLATRLDGVALPPVHGSPLRLVAPAQYGYKSVKHLIALEYRLSYAVGSAGLKEHPRGRVAREERSRLLPGLVWRHIWASALPAVRRCYRAV